MLSFREVNGPYLHRFTTNPADEKPDREIALER